MALREFRHVRATTLDEASALAAGGPGGAFPVAGGTDLLGLMKDGVHRSYPELLVDLKGIPGLDSIAVDEGGARIGALATLAQVASSPVIRERYPLLAEAARSVASPQIRNMGTVGGNICQEPRCWYYRNPGDRFHCLRKGGGTCNAIQGENRFHSIFGAAKLGSPSCVADCPVNVEIPRYLGLLRSGDLAGAARILLGNNPMPAVTGRVCPHFCERSCNRGGGDSAVSVRAIERRLGDFILESADVLTPPPERLTGRRVAVVGSGPAGLSAAFYLRRAGHEVTVFERMPAAGGMLAYGIPAYRLPKAVVASLVASYRKMGIVFELGSEIGGGGTSLAALRGSFERVFLATGAWRQRTISIPGAELLDSGLEFLAEIQRGGRELPGRKVLVIGGGNVAVDVAISALRLGAKEVTMACLEARELMPAFPEDIEQALREGVRLLPSWGPSSVLAREGGGAAGLELIRCSSAFDAQGRFNPSYDPAQRMSLEADRAFLAIGQACELDYASDSLKIERGLVVADGEDQSTSFEGLYAGGDMTTGPASVVGALAAGRRAARAIDRSLGGQGSTPLPDAAGAGFHEIRPEALRGSERIFIPSIQTSLRAIGAEDVATITQAEVEMEARRCLDCGCVAVNASDLAPALVALEAIIRTNRRSISAEAFFAARPLRTTALEEGELVAEIELPPPERDARFGFYKFRVRNSIDFPIVSLAAAFVVEKGKIERARLVFGAVAPTPLRAGVVEDFLVGRSPDEETAEAAGSLAARGAFPLERNGYKVQILRALIRRAVLAVL